MAGATPPEIKTTNGSLPDWLPPILKPEKLLVTAIPK
jgi:hypothetical protein